MSQPGSNNLSLAARAPVSFAALGGQYSVRMTQGGDGIPMLSRTAYPDHQRAWQSPQNSSNNGGSVVARGPQWLAGPDNQDPARTTANNNDRYPFAGAAPVSVRIQLEGNQIRYGDNSYEVVEHGLRMTNPPMRTQVLAEPARLTFQPTQHPLPSNGSRNRDDSQGGAPARSLNNAPVTFQNAEQRAAAPRTGWVQAVIDNTGPQQPMSGFRPSSMLNPVVRARRENPTRAEQERREAAGVSRNYRGNHHLPRNRPAPIPQDQNCSVFITGLPAGITTRELLAPIRDTGRIWASVINPPAGQYRTAAAKITFFTARAAQRFLARANDPHGPGFIVSGSRVVVRPDRNRVAESSEPVDRTRCLMISGPRDIVTVERLSAYFSAHFVYELDEIIPLVQGRVLSVQEWRFGSFRCQAQWAFRNLSNDPFFQARGVRVNFEPDPCDERR